MAVRSDTEIVSIRKAKEILDMVYPSLSPAITSETEDFGWDVRQGENLWEIKTNSAAYGDWYQWLGTRNVKTALAPEIEMGVDEIAECAFPSQEEIDAADAGKHERTKYFPLNVTGWNNEVVGNKWWKIVHEPKSCLMVIFSDGAVLLEHRELIGAAKFYGWIRTSRTKYNGPVYWQLKVFINLRKGRFISFK